MLELLSLREMHDDYILYIRSIFYDNFERKLIFDAKETFNDLFEFGEKFEKFYLFGGDRLE